MHHRDDQRDRKLAENRDFEGLLREVARGRITRRQFVERALAMGLSATAAGGLLAACGTSGSTSSSASPAAMDTTKPAQINLYNWSDYMSPQVKKDFQKATGIKVVESYFDDNEALLAKLKAGATGYDVIVPSDYMVHIMIKTGLLHPLDMKYIPNYQYTDEQFKKPAYDNPDENGGFKYSIPYQWGTTGYGVRTDKLDPATVGKWADLWNPQYKGQIDMLNDEREDLGAALIMTGYRDTGKPYSINTTDPNQINTAMNALIEQKPLVRQYDSINMKRSMAGGVPLTMCWNGDALMAIDALGGDAKAKKLVKFMLPQEGFPWWVDNMCIPKGATSVYGAHLFLNYILDPKVMGKISSWTWYLPVEMVAAKPYTDPFVFITTPQASDMARGQVYNDLGAAARLYTQAWEQVKSA